MKPSVVVDLLLSNKDMTDKLEKLVSERRETNEASLDATMYKGELRSYLEKLPEFELMKIVEKLNKDKKEIQEGYDNHQGVENNDATRGHHNYNDSRVKSTRNGGQKEECLGGHDQQVTDVGTACPPNLDQNPLVVNPCGYNDSEVRPKIDKEARKKHLGFWHDEQVTDYHGVNRKGNSMTPQNSSKGEIKERRNKQHSWEFPSPNPDELQPRDSSRAGEESAESEEESSDSKSSSAGSETTSSSRQPGAISSPVQPFSDDNRNILRAIEQVDQTLVSTDQDSEPHRSCQRCHVQDAQDQLPKTPNLQTQDLELLVHRLSETVHNNSQVIGNLVQENRQSRHDRQTSCPNWDALREENNKLNDQVVNLGQHCQQLQEQIVAHEESFRNQESRIRGLTHWRVQLQLQNAAFEDIIQTQAEEKNGNEMITRCLVKKIKKLQEERNMANRRAHEVGQKEEENLKNALQNTVKCMTMSIEEIHKKYLAEKEKSEVLERKVKELEEKCKEKDQGLAEQKSSQQRTQQRDLQHRPGMNYPGDEEKDQDPKHDNEDDID